MLVTLLFLSPLAPEGVGVGGGRAPLMNLEVTATKDADAGVDVNSPATVAGVDTGSVKAGLSRSSLPLEGPPAGEKDVVEARARCRDGDDARDTGRDGRGDGPSNS
jgi:hypothetical protein